MTRRSGLKKILGEFPAAKVVSATPPNDKGDIFVVTDDGRVFRLANQGEDMFIAIEQHIGKEAGT